MSSSRRIRASIENGRRSKGPVTLQGKLSSSHNAIRHGLLAKAILLHNESPENFQQLHDQHIQRFQPTDDVELGIIEELVSCAWRHRRACGIETHAINSVEAGFDDSPIDQITNALTSLASGPLLPLLHRYQARLNHEYHRGLKNLHMLRTVLPNEPSPISEQWEAAPQPGLADPEIVAEPDPAPSLPDPPPTPQSPDPAPVIPAPPVAPSNPAPAPVRQPVVAPRSVSPQAFTPGPSPWPRSPFTLGPNYGPFPGF